ncbi:MAG: precorrin-2 C(20)-methyltransferase [Deltaproteobacteria bacterium]|jgi:precorrin-2/cobalt-factor-2 C20-methyltransferase|nr:precorrin-2 C(20)-methyltransferase [Deltaproteobacteria bacterium]
MSEYGTLYGIGVGPGDPELITLKAKKMLEKVGHVFTPVAGKGKKSIAYSIAQMFISPDATVETLLFPMTTDQTVCEEAWKENVEKIFIVLEKGSDAAFITIGDPMTYSTYSYLLKKVQSMHPQVKSITIPGITSYAAVAASANLPLAEGSDILTLIPGNTPREKIKLLLSSSHTSILLKHHKNTKDIYNILQEMNLEDKAIYVSRCGFEDQIVTSDPPQDLLEKTDYLSLLIVKKS